MPDVTMIIPLCSPLVTNARRVAKSGLSSPYRHDYHKHFTFHRDKGTGAQRMTFEFVDGQRQIRRLRAVRLISASLTQESQPALNRDGAPPTIVNMEKIRSAFQLRRHKKASWLNDT